MQPAAHRALAALLLAACALSARGEPPAVQFPAEMPPGFPRVAALHQVTEGPLHHFFGYYGMSPWDDSQRYLVVMQAAFSDRLVEADDTANIVLIDLETDTQRVITDTRAWNFQQGAMLHWLDGPGRRIVFNDREGDRVVAVVLDVETGERRTVDRPIAAVARTGTHAASISYARLRVTRPGYGYAGIADARNTEPHPADDGLYLLDLETGASELIVSLAQAFEAEPVPEGAEENLLWFNHVLFSPDGQRIFFMARIHDAQGMRQTAGFTVNTDGTDLRCVLPYAWGASHYDWLDADRMVVTSRYRGEPPWLHVLFTDGRDDHRPIAPDAIRRDGHCHFSPDGRWMLTDTYPDPQRMQTLYLVRMEDEAVAEVGRFYQPRAFRGEWRCDLHPRWRPDGGAICIDSTHDGTRQVYILELEMP